MHQQKQQHVYIKEHSNMISNGNLIEEKNTLSYTDGTVIIILKYLKGVQGKTKDL